MPNETKGWPKSARSNRVSGHGVHSWRETSKIVVPDVSRHCSSRDFSRALHDVSGINVAIPLSGGTHGSIDTYL